MTKTQTQFSRHWAMPSANTFDVEPIKGFVQKFLLRSQISVDPFARNKRLATHTNDLNPNTAAEHHLEAGDFLALLATRDVKADLIIFDPPYSPRQISECYAQIGRKCSTEDTQSKTWNDWKTGIDKICAPGGVVLSFGWNSNGMGKARGFELEELLLVAHGGAHNDTICIAERRISPVAGLFE